MAQKALNGRLFVGGKALKVALLSTYTYNIICNTFRDQVPYQSDSQVNFTVKVARY